MMRDLIEQLVRVLDPNCHVMPLSKMELAGNKGYEGYEVQVPAGTLGYIWPHEMGWG